MRYLVTGGAGFIGSHLADRLLAGGSEVLVVDDFSTGQEPFVAHNLDHPRYELVRADLRELEIAQRIFQSQRIDFVFHLAAHADVRRGTEDTRRDLERNTLVTYNVLEAMRLAGIRDVAFTSTGSIYGEPGVFPTQETAPFPIQTSFYGASKLACEGLIEAFCAGFGMHSWIFRFVSILGERYTHGHVVDFYRALRADPNRIQILGDGRQRKSYLHVGDAIDAMLLATQEATDSVNIFNIGSEETILVDESLDIITGHLGLSPRRVYTGGARGWAGDSPLIFLDTSRIRALGFRAEVSIRESIIRTLEYLRVHPFLIEARS